MLARSLGRNLVRGSAATRLFRSSALCLMEDYKPPLDHYDVFATDVTHDVLCRQIARELGRPYLQPATPADIWFPVEGKIYGQGRRHMLNLVVTRNKKRVFVSFLLDTGAPNTYIASAACDALGLDNVVPDPFAVNIHGTTLPVKTTPTNQDQCHFVGVNLLGADFLCEAKVMVVPDFPNGRFFLVPAPTLVSDGNSAFLAACACTIDNFDLAALFHAEHGEKGDLQGHGGEAQP